jgi:hypothetical protein
MYSPARRRSPSHFPTAEALGNKLTPNTRSGKKRSRERAASRRVMPKARTCKVESSVSVVKVSAHHQPVPCPRTLCLNDADWLSSRLVRSLLPKEVYLDGPGRSPAGQSTFRSHLHLPMRPSEFSSRTAVDTAETLPTGATTPFRITIEAGLAPASSSLGDMDHITQKCRAMWSRQGEITPPTLVTFQC